MTFGNSLRVERSSSRPPSGSRRELTICIVCPSKLDGSSIYKWWKNNCKSSRQVGFDRRKTNTNIYNIIIVLIIIKVPNALLKLSIRGISHTIKQPIVKFTWNWTRAMKKIRNIKPSVFSINVGRLLNAVSLNYITLISEVGHLDRRRKIFSRTELFPCLNPPLLKLNDMGRVRTQTAVSWALTAVPTVWPKPK